MLKNIEKLLVIAGLMTGSYALAYSGDITHFNGTSMSRGELDTGSYICSAGGPVSFNEYNQKYQYCLHNYCPKACAFGGHTDGKYFSNGRYQIYCVCN